MGHSTEAYSGGSVGVICPKCGYQQEERIDCLRCGVVFTKYYALHPEIREWRPEPSDLTIPLPQPTPQPTPQPIRPSPPDLENIELAQIRLSLRDLSRRLTEMDVERAERIRLRGELAALEEKLQESSRQFSGRLAELQREVKERAEVSSVQTELAALRNELRENLSSLQKQVREQNPAPIISRLEKLESSVERLRGELPQGTDPAISHKMSRLETGLSQLEEKLRTVAEQRGKLQSDASTLELGKVLKEMDTFRTSLQNVSVRYAEIADLKKNHLEMTALLESMQRHLEHGKEAEGKAGSKKLNELSNEVAALRAESKQLLQQLQHAESSDKERLAEIQRIKETLGAEPDSRSEREERLEAGFARLEALVKENLAPQTKAPRGLNDLSAKVQRIEQQVQGLQQTHGQVQALKDHLERQITEQGGAPDPMLLSKLREMEIRFAELERRMRPPTDDSGRIRPTDALLELGKVLKELDGFRHAMQNLAAQYSEIAQLKKDYIDLSGTLDTMQGDLSSFKKEISAGSDSPHEERAALQEGLQQLHERLDSTDTATTARLAEIEARLKTEMKMLVKVQEIEGRQTTLEARLAAVSNQIGKSLSEEYAKDWAAIRKDMEGLRKSLEGVTLKYTEIGELKKNQLVVTDRMDLIHHQLAALKGENSGVSLAKKVEDLAREIATLRAESKQLVSNNETLEGKIAALQTQPVSEPLPPMEEAIQAIRLNLEEIRRFMSSLSQKL